MQKSKHQSNFPGRMFALTNKGQINREMAEKIKDAEDTLPNLEVAHARFELKVKSEMENMFELQKEFRRLGVNVNQTVKT